MRRWGSWPWSGSDGSDRGPPPELVAVSHERELRGAWIATVANINFPSSQGLPVAAMQEETPPMWERADDEVPYPDVAVQGTHVTLTPGDDTPLRAWVVYRDSSDGGGTFVLDRIVPLAHGDTIELSPGRWAVSAAARTDVESMGVVVEL